jgi:large subunit ribosomal protein L3
MSVGLIGRKVGMTSVFAEDGTMVPVSVLAVEPNTVTAIRTVERDGYAAVQLGAGTARRLSKPRLGQLKDLPRVRDVREFRLEAPADYEVGQTLDVSLFEAGDTVDVTGVSKGKGFSGTIKRHHFRRGPETHGSDSHRQPGCIGAGTTPGRVYRGMGMAGHLGDDRVTVFGSTASTETGTIVPSSAKTWVMPTLRPISPMLIYILISMSTPAGSESRIRASTVFEAGSRMSMSRLWVRISNCSRLSLSINGERRTVNFSMRVGSGTGPTTSAPVRWAVSTICRAD